MDRSILRFPRTTDRDLNYMIKVKCKYPPPPYDKPKNDKSPNPADIVFRDLMRYGKKKLRRLCKKHSLDPTGPRRKLLKRMYLHWRASNLKLPTSSENFGYGPGYENTRTPDCSCGFLRQDYMAGLIKRKIEDKEIQKRQMEYFLMKKIMRFPRNPEGWIPRFPRLR